MVAIFRVFFSPDVEYPYSPRRRMGNKGKDFAGEPGWLAGGRGRRDTTMRKLIAIALTVGRPGAPRPAGGGGRGGSSGQGGQGVGGFFGGLVGGAILGPVLSHAYEPVYAPA